MHHNKFSIYIKFFYYIIEIPTKFETKIFVIIKNMCFDYIRLCLKDNIF